MVQLQVFFTQQKINDLLQDNNWWEDDVINTFLSLLSQSFKGKYKYSIIHPQVVVVNYFSELGTSFYGSLTDVHNYFFVIFLPYIQATIESGSNEYVHTGHYVVVAIYMRVQHVSIYSSGSNQDGVLDELKPQIIGFLESILLDVDNLTFSDCQHPNYKSYEGKNCTIRLYFNLTIESPICGPMVLWCIIHIHLKLYIHQEMM